MSRKSQPKIELLSHRKVCEFTGKALVGALTRDEQLMLCNHITAMEQKLDECDLEDWFGTEGWRHHFGQPDAD